MKYLSVVTRISMIVLFMSLIFSIDNDDATKKYLISAACIVSAALTLKLNSYQK